MKRTMEVVVFFNSLENMERSIRSSPILLFCAYVSKLHVPGF